MSLVSHCLTLLVALSNSKPVFGTPVNLTATLYPSNCTGTVNFWVGQFVADEFSVSSFIGSSDVVAGKAYYTWGAPYGQGALIAIYDGDDNSYGSTSDYVNITSLVTVSVLLNATSIGSSAVQLNAYLNPSTAIGAVNFYTNKAGTTYPFLLGTSTVVDGIASLNWTTAAPGINQYQAEYTGSW